MKTKPNPFISSLRNPISTSFRVAPSILAIAAALTSAAYAVDGTWAVDAAGNWNDAANWSSNPTVPGGAGSTVGLTADITGNRTVTINTTSATVGTLNIADPTTSFFAYTLAASGGASLILDNSGTGAQINHLSTGAVDIISAPILLNDNLTISNAGANGMTLSGAITAGSAGTKTITNSGSGAGTITLSNIVGNGTGTVAVLQNSATSQLTLSGTNTFGGGVTLSAGTLSLNNNAALGNGLFTINSGTTIAVTAARTTTNNNVQNWNGDFTFNGGNTLSLGTGAVTMSANRTVTVSASTLTVGGAIGDSGSGFSLTKEGAGTLVLSGANTYSAGTRINGGVLQFNAGAVPASGLITINAGGTLNANGTLPSVAGWLGKINTSSSGVLALTGNSAENINFTGYNGLVLGASSPSIYTGTLAPSGGIYRLGGGGSTLTVSTALTGGNSLVVGTAGATGTLALTEINTYTGATTINSGTLSLAGANGSAASSAITASSGTTLLFDSSASGVTGKTRAASVTLNGASLNVVGNATANSNDTIAGALTIGAPSPNVSGAANAVILLPDSGTTNAQLTAGSLVRVNNGVAFFRGPSLGENPIGNNFGFCSNIVFTSGPALVGGGGAAGTKNISILPWAVGGLAASGAPTSLVTYDANGIRPLFVAEFDTNIPATSSTNNVRLSGTSPVTVDGNTTVNSLFLSNAAASTVIIAAGTAGSLTVTSGAIYADFSLGGNSDALTISKPVDFGAVEGVIGTTATANSKTLSFSGGISGSGGITIYDVNGVTSTSQAGVNIAAATTYTGNTIINGSLIASNINALPNFANASRTGDVYVNGTLGLSGSNNTSVRINGLYGTGKVVTPFSNNETFIVGDNNATSTFDGSIVQGTGAIGLTKVGTGTLTLTRAANAWTAATNIQNGVLSVVSLNNIASPNPTSGLGKPTTVANGTIGFGNLTTTGQLTVTGTGETTDRVISLSGRTGGAIIDQSGTGLLKFTSDLTAPGANSTDERKILTLQGSTAGTGEISGAIVDSVLGTAAQKATSVVKAGSGTWTLSGVNSYSGSTTVSGGTLRLSTATLNDASVVDVASGAALNLTHGISDVVAEFRINGISQGNGTFNASNTGGRITGSGSLQVGPVSSDPFVTWISTFPSITGPDTAKSADPDKDGQSNYVEFALDGNPASGAATGKVRSRIETVGADQALVITLPVRAGAVFDNLPGPAADATIDNLIYTIAGTNDLSAFDQGVTEIAVSSTLMPTLSSASWTYRTFRLNGAVGGGTPRGPKGFLRAAITSTP
ncbi:MAG: autotransporter-associated beta strand repeat-containing protein [Luteolibacter sp.]